jgi:hypothetical protein
METTYSRSAITTSSKEKNAPTSEHGLVSRKAMITFLLGAAIVFSFAIYYSISTDHGGVAAALAIAYSAVCFVAASFYRSFN